MEINSIGNEYFTDYRLSVPMSGISEYGSGNIGSFADVLKNAREPQRSEAGSVSSKSPHIDKNDKLYEQCLELETFIIKTLIGSMRKTIQKSSLIDEGFAGKMYEDMLYDEYAKEFAKNAGFGLAEQAYLELTGQRGVKINHLNI